MAKKVTLRKSLRVEWEGLEHVKELQNKFQAFKRLLEKYTVTKIKDAVFLYKKK